MPTTVTLGQPYEKIIGDFQNQVVVILGGNSGIGYSTVESFYNQGARVYVLGLTPLPKEYSVRGTAEANQYIRDVNQQHKLDMPDVVSDRFPRHTPQFTECNVTDARDGQLDIVRRLREIADNHGKIDVLTDSIGFSPRKPLDEIDPAYMANVRAANADYLPIMLNAIKPWMKNGGRVVIIGSTLPHGVSETTALPYATAKAARLTAALGMSKDLGQMGIDLCVLSPSHVPTPNEAHILGAQAEITRHKAQEGRVNHFDMRANDVARFVVAAASPQFSRMVAGTELFLGSNKGGNAALQRLTQEFVGDGASSIGMIVQELIAKNSVISREAGGLSASNDALRSDMRIAEGEIQRLRQLLIDNKIDPEQANPEPPSGTGKVYAMQGAPHPLRGGQK